MIEFGEKTEYSLIEQFSDKILIHLAKSRYRDDWSIRSNDELINIWLEMINNDFRIFEWAFYFVLNNDYYDRFILWDQSNNNIRQEIKLNILQRNKLRKMVIIKRRLSNILSWDQYLEPLILTVIDLYNKTLSESGKKPKIWNLINNAIKKHGISYNFTDKDKKNLIFIIQHRIEMLESYTQTDNWLNLDPEQVAIESEDMARQRWDLLEDDKWLYDYNNF